MSSFIAGTGVGESVSSAEIANDSIVNEDINSAAAIAYSKLAALTAGNILVGSAGNVATSVNPSGDVDISNAGVFSKAGAAMSPYFAPQGGEIVSAAAAATGTTNRLYYMLVVVPWSATLTGVRYYVGGTANGNVRSALYDSTGARVANATADSAQPGTNQVHAVPFDGTYAAPPGTYFAALLFSSATATAFFNSPMVPGGQADQGGFTNPSSITAPTAIPATAIMLSTY